MKLAIFTYDHRHGTDICVHAVPDDWTSVRAEKYARQELEAEYGKEDIAIETEKYDPSLPLAFKIARLFRQPSPGDWEGVLGRVLAELER